MSPEIINEIESVYQKDILTAHVPLTRENYLSYCPFGLSQGTSQTNKHNHFKNIEVASPETLTENRKPIKNLRAFAVRKTHWPLLGKNTLPNPVFI